MLPALTGAQAISVHLRLSAFICSSYRKSQKTLEPDLFYHKTGIMQSFFDSVPLLALLISMGF